MLEGLNKATKVFFNDVLFKRNKKTKSRKIKKLRKRNAKPFKLLMPFKKKYLTDSSHLQEKKILPLAWKENKFNFFRDLEIKKQNFYFQYNLLGPSLPILNDVIYFAKNELHFKQNFKNFIFVCGQHLLSTTISLFETLIALGAEPRNIFVVGKNYSNNEKVIELIKQLGVNVQSSSEQLILGGFSSAYNSDIMNMWENCYAMLQMKKDKEESISGIIILDDGGHVSTHMPAKVKYFKPSLNSDSSEIGIVCIEQTSSGIDSTRLLPIPTIEVATTALKNWIEPSLVADKCTDEMINALRRIQTLYKDISLPRQPVFGIIGLGKVGYAVLESLIEKGHRNFIIYDKNEEKVKLAKKNINHHEEIIIESVDFPWALFNNSDVIVGCTGYDVTLGNLDVFKTIKSPKILISCSSKDTEFLTLLLFIQEKNRNLKKPFNHLEDIYYKNGFHAPVILARGGTPIGFANGLNSVAPRGIEPIRGLKIMACLQAYYMIMNKHKNPNNYMVSPVYQKFIIEKWLASKPPSSYTKHLIDSYDEDKIKNYSGGTYYDMNSIKAETRDSHYVMAKHF